MKFATLALLVATVSAQEDDMEALADAPVGDDCSPEEEGGNGLYYCQTTGLSCVQWTDSGDMTEYSTCQDCTEDATRTVSDSMGESASFRCVDDEDSAKTLLMSGAALISAIAMMA